MAASAPNAAKSLYGTMDAERASNASGRDLEGGEHKQKLPLGSLGLTMLVFFNVSGGPFMCEDAVAAAGPLFAVIGILVIVVFYAIPSALLTAELSTTFPEDAGVAAWVTAAFGPRWGFTQGALFWLQGAISLATYPQMLKDYLRYAICPSGLDFRNGIDQEWAGFHQRHCAPLDDHMLSFVPSNGALIIVVFVLGTTWLNWRGLKLVGSVTVLFVGFVLLPFIVLCAVGFFGSNLHPGQWLRDRPYGTRSVADINWLNLFNTLFWLLNYWDSASTLAGEVDEPEKAIPSALSFCMVVTVCGYILPILTCTAALPGQPWATGFWVQAGYELGGHVLQWWVFSAALVSFSGQFLSGQATVAYELFGMAELGQIPVCFTTRNAHGVPIWSLVLSILTVALVLMVGNLGVAMGMSNGVYSLAELISFVTFLKLRWSHPKLSRPFKIPLEFAGCCLLLLSPFVICAGLVISPFWTGQWAVAGCIFVAAACLLIYKFIDWCRDLFPEASLPLRPRQLSEWRAEVPHEVRGD